MLTRIDQAKPKNEVAVSQSTTELPASLDFFKYAKSNPKGTKQKPSAVAGIEDHEGPTTSHINQKRKREDDEDDEDDQNSPSAPLYRHKVTAKGLRVPAQADTFEEMERRFSISSTLMKNIAACNYKMPTAIQQSGIPILSEVISYKSIKHSLTVHSR